MTFMSENVEQIKITGQPKLDKPFSEGNASYANYLLNLFTILNISQAALKRNFNLCNY